MTFPKSGIFLILSTLFALSTGCSSGGAVRSEFLSSPARELETFRIYADSEKYVLEQLNYKGTIQVVEDPSGEKLFMEEIKKFDKIDRFNVAIFKVEVYEETGTIARIRPVKPAEISEINKIIADDITRLQFEFSEDKIEPLVFEIQYGIRLQKKASDDEVEKLLKENVQ